MKNFFKISCIAIFALCGACSMEAPFDIEVTEDIETSEINVCQMTFESPKPSFEGTSRGSGDEWGNGDCIYLKFVKADESIVTGKAIYDANDKIWNLEYTGTLSSIVDAKCVASYFEDGVTEDATYVNFSATTGIYFGVGKYTKSANGLNVNVTLSPYQSRIRFKGTPGTKFSLSGPHAYICFKKDKFLFYYVSTVESSINSDGYSPYLYLTLYDTERIMSISYDNLSFTMTCESPVLDDGKSGYMNLPTKNSHNGWEMKETAAPTLGETSVSNVEANSADFSSSIISDGNASITDCGFVYSLSQNVTLDNMSIKCSVSSFKATASDLAKNTTYYVRAYATNSVGTAYGPETSFTTTAGAISVKNGLSAYFMFEKDYADASGNDNGGFGVGSPEFVSGIETGSFALYLNSKSYMLVPTSIHDTKENSISFWIKDPQDGHILATLVKESATHKGPILSLEMENGNLKYIIGNGNNSYNYRYEKINSFAHSTLTDGKWHHVTLVSSCVLDYNVSTYVWNKKLYIDGVLNDQLDENDELQQTTINYGLKFQLGGEKKAVTDMGGCSSISGAKMTIDNFRAYKRCLSADEVLEIYNSEKQ